MSSHLQKCLLCSVISTALFFMLSPGVLLTLPPTHNTQCDGEILMVLNKSNDECATSYAAAAVHAVIFGVLMFLMCMFICKEKS